MRKERKPPRFRERFLAHYDQYREHDGKRMTFVRRESWKNLPDLYDREVGTLYRVELETGEEIVCWPEECIHGACMCHADEGERGAINRYHDAIRAKGGSDA